MPELFREEQPAIDVHRLAGLQAALTWIMQECRLSWTGYP
jgi:hypothetical protein